MTPRPQLIRDGVGWHLVAGAWTISRARFRWRPASVNARAQLGAVELFCFSWLGVAVSRIRRPA